MQKRNKTLVVEYTSNSISQEQIIEMQAEAYYRALKRIEDEKARADEKNPEKKKYKWYQNVLFILNVLFWPWRISKIFNISNRLYDSVLVLFVSGIMQIIGGFMWSFGIFLVAYVIYQTVTSGVMGDIVYGSPFLISFLLLGSTFVLAGEEFGKETDSNKIYAYSASIMTLISCVVGIITMIGKR